MRGALESLLREGGNCLMALTIWTLLPGDVPVTQDQLQNTKSDVLSCAPDGSRVQVRGIDQPFMLFEVSADGGPSRPIFGDELANDHLARIAATIWLPDDLEDPEVRAVETIDRLHAGTSEPLASA